MHFDFISVGEIGYFTPSGEIVGFESGVNIFDFHQVHSYLLSKNMKRSNESMDEVYNTKEV